MRDAWRQGAVAAAVASIGCRGFYAEQAAVEATTTTTPWSSGDGDAADAGDVPSAPREDMPSRPAPPEFELPEGCGDGVPAPGQFCFTPLWVDDYRETVGSPVAITVFDVDGDGRDELISELQARNDDNRLLVHSWDGDGFELRQSVPTALWGGLSPVVDTSWDWTEDGITDITRPYATPTSGGKVTVHERLADGTIGPGDDVFSGTPGFVGETPERIDLIDGYSVPIDLDGDRAPELIYSRQVGFLGGVNPDNELVAIRRDGTQWVEIGTPIPFGPSGVVVAHQYGDFNEDGHRDVLLIEDTLAFDPIPDSFDPAWHKAWVFLASGDGSLVFVGTFPTGGVTGHLAFNSGIDILDVDGDGHDDAMLRASDVPLVWMRGRGDGTFDQGVPVMLKGASAEYLALRIADYDGDGMREWFLGRAPAIAPLDFMSAELVYIGDNPDSIAGWGITSADAVGDVNGDGIDDFMATTTSPTLDDNGHPIHARQYAFISTP